MLTIHLLANKNVIGTCSASSLCWLLQQLGLRNHAVDGSSPQCITATLQYWNLVNYKHSMACRQLHEVQRDGPLRTIFTYTSDGCSDMRGSDNRPVGLGYGPKRARRVWTILIAHSNCYHSIYCWCTVLRTSYVMGQRWGWTRSIIVMASNGVCFDGTTLYFCDVSIRAIGHNRNLPVRLRRARLGLVAVITLALLLLHRKTKL